MVDSMTMCDLSNCRIQSTKLMCL